MNIIVDCASGDFAPYAPLAGAIEAAKRFDICLTLVGDESVFRSLAQTHNWDLSSDRFTFVHTSKKVEMTDEALCVVREKADSSMAIALNLLKEGKGDALVSAGNTGALHAGSALLVRRVPHLRRAPIATLLPLQKETLLLDAGASTNLTPYQLWQFSKMGCVYMQCMLGIETPKVGLVNIGKEPQKGTPLQRETYALLQADPDLDFYGNVEGNEIPSSPCDILVTDGFSGNLILKLLEGMGSHIQRQCKQTFQKSIFTKTGALFLKKPIRNLFSAYRSQTYGGAPFLGISRPIIKAHGNSGPDAICAAISQAICFLQSDVTQKIADALRKMPLEKEAIAQEKGDCL